MIVACVVTELSVRKGKMKKKTSQASWPPGVWYAEEAITAKSNKDKYDDQTERHA